MSYRLMTIGVVFLVVAMAGYLSAGRLETYQKNIPADSKVKTVHLDGEFDGVEFKFESHAGGDMMTADVRYDDRRIDVNVESEIDASSAYIFLSSDNARRRNDLDAEDCCWRVSLSRDVTWAISMDFGFMEGEFDLSGLPLEDLKLDLGAADCQISFDTPNPAKMRDIDVDAGAGDLKLHGLGYANFEHLDFNGGAGEYYLNFDGLEKGFRTAEIDIGVGEVNIDLPSGIPVRIEADDGWLSSVRLKKSNMIRVRDGVYESEDFNDAEYGLEIHLDIGIGEATIGWADGPKLHFASTLPAIPAIPAIPEIPAMHALKAIPAIPALPEMPELPDLVTLPEIPEIPEIPDIPKIYLHEDPWSDQRDGKDRPIIIHRPSKKVLD